MSKPDGSHSARRLRIAAAAIVSAGLLVPLAVFGGTGLAQSTTAVQVQYKITICHHTHSAKNPTVTIRISNKAWPAHQKHGDTLGPCANAKKHGKENANHGKNGKHGKSGTHGKSTTHSQSATHRKNGSTNGRSGTHGQGGSNGQNGSTNGQSNGNGNGNGNGGGQGNGKGHGK